MTSLIRLSINIFVLLILAAIPIGFSNMDGRVNVDLSIMFTNTSSFLKSLFSGDSWYYHVILRIKNIKAMTVKVSSLSSSCFKYCTEEGLLAKNPVKNIPFPEEEDKLPRYLQRDELFQLLVKG